MDQNRNTLRSKLTLTDDGPTYRISTNGRGVWIYDADNGFIALYELEQGTPFVVWGEMDSARLVACYVPESYSETQSSYEGAALSSSREEINGTFAKLGNSVPGGAYTATQS